MAVAQQTFHELREAKLADLDPEVVALIGRELERQRGVIELIASENFTWPSVFEGQASVPTNKYAEGYPGKRYYGGCEVVDEIEQLAIDRAKALFGAEHANVQPHAGAQTNMAVYFACLQPGDTILAMRLDHGGHLTHGLKVNFSGRLYDIATYGVDRETGLIDFDEVRRVAEECKPKLIVCGASAYPRADRRRAGSARSPTRSARCSSATWPTSQGSWPPGSTRTRRRTATSSAPRPTRRSPARARASCSARRSTPRRSTRRSSPGCRAARSCTRSRRRRPASRSPRRRASARTRRRFARTQTRSRPDLRTGVSTSSPAEPTRISSRSTCGAATGLGKDAEERLDEVRITANRNTVPFDERPPTVASGLRLGTPAVTMRGFEEEDLREVGSIVVDALSADADVAALAARSEALCERHPLYPGFRGYVSFSA